MSWGTGAWADSPWGGGEPSVAGNVQIDTVRFITPTYIRLQLNTQVIVNAGYLATSNYTAAIRSDTPVPANAVGVLRVIAPAQDVLIADYVYLETTPFSDGGTYDISFVSLDTLDGVAAGNGFTAPVQARVSKTMLMLKSLPAHFDKRLDSLLHALVSAISIQDDTIGGSRNDEYAGGTVVPLLGGFLGGGGAP